MIRYIFPAWEISRTLMIILETIFDEDLGFKFDPFPHNRTVTVTYFCVEHFENDWSIEDMILFPVLNLGFEKSVFQTIFIKSDFKRAKFRTLCWWTKFLWDCDVLTIFLCRTEIHLSLFRVFYLMITMKNVTNK